MILAAGKCLIGLILLLGGGEWLVRGASQLARAFGVSALVVGLTVVAAGTSAPELIVSVSGVLRGSADIAAGNVLGSNIFNSLVILGLSAIAAPLAIRQRFLRREVPIMIAVTALLGAAAWGGVLARWEGGVALALLVGFLVLSVRSARGEPKAVREEYQEFVEEEGFAPHDKLRSGTLVVFGCAALAVGGDMLVDGATTLARLVGMTERVIALTLVAGGTSMPELATSVVAARRGERDIAVSNVVGSNILNVLLVLGTASAIRPLALAPGILRLDWPVAFASSLVLLRFFATGREVSRAEGTALVGGYVAYVAMLLVGVGAPG